MPELNLDFFSEYNEKLGFRFFIEEIQGIKAPEGSMLMV
jgi:hypothetical protein